MCLNRVTLPEVTFSNPYEGPEPDMRDFPASGGRLSDPRALESSAELKQARQARVGDKMK